jgi:hypothetical protein
MTTHTQNPRLHDVVDWLVHEGFNIRAASVTNAVAARVVGDSLMGQVAYSSDGGATWKILATGDNLAAANVRLAVLIPTRAVTAAIGSSDVMANVRLIHRGPGRIHKKGLVLNAGVVAATVYTILENQNLQVVDETGALFSNTFGS